MRYYMQLTDRVGKSLVRASLWAASGSAMVPVLNEEQFLIFMF